MIISIIAAIAKNGVIGKDNTLPWHLPADLKHFKEITTGHALIMGRRTYESIGRPLPKRKNIILTRKKDYFVNGCLIAHSLEEALALVKDEEEVFFIGGSEIFHQVLPLAYRLYLTLINKNFPGDVYFPSINPEEWQEISRQKGIIDEKNPYEYEFIIFERKKNKV